MDPLDVDLWLDDVRIPEPPFEGALRVRTADEAIEALKGYTFAWASLDHDLGHRAKRGHNEETGYTVVLWMAEYDIWPVEGIVVHSWNIVGARLMCDTVDRYGPYDKPTQMHPAIGLPA